MCPSSPVFGSMADSLDTIAMLLGTAIGYFDLLREVKEGSGYGILLKILPLVLKLLPGNPFTSGAEVYAYTEDWDWVKGHIVKVN